MNEPYTLEKVVLNGKEGYVLVDRNGYYKRPEEGIDIARKLLLAYGIAGIHSILENENIKRSTHTHENVSETHDHARSC